MTATEKLARFVLETTYHDLPPKTVQYAKNLALSVLGSIIWGSTLPAGKIIARLLKEMGGATEAGVIGSGFKAPVANAALAGGSFAHAAEWEGDSRPEMVGVMTVFPVVFAMAEKMGLPGKDVLEAAIIAHEVQSRIGLACLPATERGFFAVPVFGNFGSAVASAKMLKLNADQICVALSIAASQAAGTLRQHDTMTHFVETGFPCRNGVLAAMLARDGFTSDMNILEDNNRGVGFCTAVAGKEGFRIEKLTEGLGKEFRTELLDTKHFPCHSLQQRSLEAILDLLGKVYTNYRDIDSVAVEMKPGIARQLDLLDPPDGEHARVSIQHGIAAAILEKKIGIDSFTDEKATDAKFKEVRQKVQIVVSPEWESQGLNDFEIVTIKLKDGKEYSSPRWETWRGHHTSPFTTEELVAKYKDATSGTLSPKQIERSMQLVMNLENLKDVKELMKILTFPSKK